MCVCVCVGGGGGGGVGGGGKGGREGLSTFRTSQLHPGPEATLNTEIALIFPS